MAWFDLLQPASFAGVPFYVERTERRGGRRPVVNEYPDRDAPYVEDLGRAARIFTVRAYVAGDGFIAARARLEAALEAAEDGGTLVHPTYGQLRVWVGDVRSQESRDGGSYASLDIEFTLDGGTSSPLSVTDTASALLDGLNDIGAFISAAYAVVVDPIGALTGVASLLAQQLGLAGGLFGGLSATTIAGLALGFADDVQDGAATAEAVLAAFQGAAANVVAAQPAPVPGNAVTGTLPQAALPADPSGGLLSLATFGSGFAAQPGSNPNLGPAQAAVVALVQGAALLAVVTVYAQADWQSAEAAAAAQDTLQDLLDAQVAAAADAGSYDLFRAWRAISAQAVADMRARARQLPNLASYSLPGSLPALALAQRLYQDGAQADALVALNGTPHPLFMPANGLWLQAA